MRVNCDVVVLMSTAYTTCSLIVWSPVTAMQRGDSDSVLGPPFTCSNVPTD